MALRPSGSLVCGFGDAELDSQRFRVPSLVTADGEWVWQQSRAGFVG